MAVSKRKKVTAVEPEEDDVVEEPRMYSPRSPRANVPYLLIILLMAVSFFAGYLLFRMTALEKMLADSKTAPAAAGAGQEAPARPTELKVKKPEPSEHSKGNKDARYVWIEYSDLECPFCKRGHPDLVKLMDEYKDDVRWIYRHFPLQFHPKAQKSAEATECAADQGGDEAFWRMTDLIFERMPDMELAQLPAMAAEIGLDQASFQSCLDSGKFEKKVTDQLNEGSAAGVAATPSGVIYDMETGKTLLVEGALPYESLKQQLDSFMAANK